MIEYKCEDNSCWSKWRDIDIAFIFVDDN